MHFLEEELFVVLMYLATDRGIKSVDKSRRKIALAFFAGLASFLNGRSCGPESFDHPSTDFKKVNEMLVLGDTSRSETEIEFILALVELLKFRRKEYIGPPESEVWYESDFEELLKQLNRTPNFSYAMSVSDARKAETLLRNLPEECREILNRIAATVAGYMFGNRK